jgi:hypothetical protein
MPSPIFRINGGAPGAKASVSAGGDIVATLDDPSGVDTCVWSVTATDETTAPSEYTLTPFGPSNSSVVFSAADFGTAGILRCIINGGISKATKLPDPIGTTSTAKWFVPDAGFEVGAAGEQMESDPTYGSTGLFNSAIRACAGLQGTTTSQAAQIAALQAAEATDASNIAINTSNIATNTVTISTLPRAMRIPILAGVVSTDNGSASPVVLGCAVWKPILVPLNSPSIQLVAVLWTLDASYAATVKLYDVSGVLSGGTPGYVTGAQVSSTSTSAAMAAIDLTSLLGSAPPLPLLEAHLFASPSLSGKRVTCAGAWIDIS